MSETVQNKLKDKAEANPQLEPIALPEGEESLIKTQEIGGPSGPEPTRFGDWERKGRCVDF